jgi:hypothetical protein
MTKNLRRLAAVLLLAVAAMPAGASTYSADYTDLWYNPNESGWGVNLIQQSHSIFASLFVYGTDTSPRWYTASDLEPSPAGSTTRFSGTLYLSTGPYFGATSFDPNAVNRTAVGTMTISFDTPTTATLQYTVNGAPVTKSMVRYAFQNENLSGNYLGGLTAIGASCTQASLAGPILIFRNFSVQQNGAQVAMNVSFTSNQGQESQCGFSGGYTQAGRQGTIQGSWSCNINGQAANAGSFTLSSIDATVNGFTGRFHGNDQFCTYDGQFGGVRDVPTQ